MYWNITTLCLLTLLKTDDDANVGTQHLASCFVAAVPVEHTTARQNSDKVAMSTQTRHESERATELTDFLRYGSSMGKATGTRNTRPASPEGNKGIMSKPFPWPSLIVCAM